MPATQISLPKPGHAPRPAFIPPHAIPERRPRPVVPDGAQLLSRAADARRMGIRGTILATLALAFGLTACGRSDALEDDPAGIYAVDAARDIELDDGTELYVEIAAPADPLVSTSVMSLDDGCTFDELVDALAPEGELKIDHFGDVAMHVKVDRELRAVLWQ